MSSPNQLSFLPDDYLEQKAQLRSNTICAAMFVVVFVGCAGALALAKQPLRQEETRGADVDRRYAEAARRIQQVQQMQEKQRRMAHQVELTAALLEKVPRSFVLAEITNSLPAGVSLLEFNLESKVRAAPTMAKTAFEQKKAELEAQKKAAAAMIEPRRYDVSMKIVGLARTDVQVAQLINKLSQSRLLCEVNLIVSEQYKQGEEQLRRFELELMLKPDAEVTPDWPASSRTAAVEVQGH